MDGDVFVAPVSVSDRPALLLLLTGFAGSAEDTEQMSTLIRKGGFALERILWSRKL